MSLWDSISGWFGGGSSDAIGNAAGASDATYGGYSGPATTPSTGGSDFNSQFYSSLITAGTGLASVYFKQSGDKQLAEEAAKQRMAELAYAAANQKGGGGGGGGGGNAMALAKLNNISQIYQNWAALEHKNGELQATTALKTGEAMQNPIIARAGALR